MTLNLTLVGRKGIVQVSDRLYSYPDTGEVRDESNKAIIIRCADATLSITFTGIATFFWNGQEHRIDQWLAESLQVAGLPELPHDQVLAHIQKVATDLFRSFPSVRRRHTFVVSGFVQSSDNPVPHAWFVDNCAGNEWFQQSGDSFHIHDMTVGPGRFLATGFVKAMSRRTKRRLKKELDQKLDVGGIERALVRAIRDAAADPQGSRVISKNCMAITLDPLGGCRAVHYSESGGTSVYGPFLMWYEGGRSFIVGDIEVLEGSGLALQFGDQSRPFFLQVRWDEPMVQPDIKELHSRMKVRTANAVHRTEEPVVSAPLMTIITKDPTPWFPK